MTSVSGGVQKRRQMEALVVAKEREVSTTRQEKMLQTLTVMQGSIWEFSDSQPWFIAGLHKNNPQATRQALESLIRVNSVIDITEFDRRRGAVSLKDGGEIDTKNSQGLFRPSGATGDRLAVPQTDGQDTASDSEGGFLYSRRFSGNPQMKIVIKKTVELVGDMAKSRELAFHAVRAVARFMTYPTPSVPSDNFVFGHAKGWLWLIYKGLSHFNHDKTDRKDLDIYLKVFRREMSLLAKEANWCISDINIYMSDLKKLNVAIRKEAKLLKRRRTSVWGTSMQHFLHYLDDLKSRREQLVDTSEDRFFSTDWIFEPHPSQTKLQWDFFHFQWIDLKRDWIDCEFEIRSDYSLHWTTYTSFPPELQSEMVVHLIQHLKALIEECHNFHKLNMHLSFDYQEIKFLSFAVEEIGKLKTHKEAVDFITAITRKLFEDLALLQKISEEYVTNLEWLGNIIEPCYRTLNHWLADDLILPLEFSARIRNRPKWFCDCSYLRRSQDFLEMFGEPLNVVLLRSPISLTQLDKFFPPKTQYKQQNIPNPINSYGISRGYTSSIFDTGLGRERPLPIHHPLPKYKKQPEQMFNIFDIHRLFDLTVDCVIARENEMSDVDIEKYLVVAEEMQRFWAVFGTIFTFIMTDIKERVETLELLMYSNLPEHYESLDRMIAYEKSKQMENTEKSGTKAFLRLHKIFQFMVYFLKKASSLNDTDLTYYACKSAYYRSYAKVQGWIYQKAATFSMYSLPTKLEMYTSLFAELEKRESDARVKDFLRQGYRIIDICNSISKSHNIS